VKKFKAKLTSSHLLFIFPLMLLTLGQGAAKAGALGWGTHYYFISYVALILRGFVWIIILRKFSLSYAYPVMSLGYLLILILSIFLFEEVPTLRGMAGLILVLFGVYAVHRGENYEN